MSFRRFATLLMAIVISFAVNASEITKIPVKDAKVFDVRHAPLKAKIKTSGMGKGVDAIILGHKQKLEWRVPATVKPGKYYVKLQFASGNFLTFNEMVASRTFLYLNDHRFSWRAATVPVKKTKTSRRYTSTMESDPMEMKPGDILRMDSRMGGLLVGPLVLSDKPLSGDLWRWSDKKQVFRRAWRIFQMEFGKNTEKNGEIKQNVELLNPGSTTRKLSVTAIAHDYERRILLKKTEEISIAPGEIKNLEYVFKASNTVRDSLLVTTQDLTSDDASIPLEIKNFYIHDIKVGPRRKLWLSGDWKYSMLPPEITELRPKPPKDAKWENIKVPSYLPKNKSHCAWYKKEFEAPNFLKGERYVLTFGSALYESKIYVNGKMVHYQEHGSEPFECDISDAFRPGEKNEILISLRDWLAYSPKNRALAKKGEGLKWREDVTWPVGHIVKWLGYGLNGNITLETRPSLAVKDIFVVTDVENKKLSLRYTIVNKSGKDEEATLTPMVLNQGKKIFTLDSANVKVPAGGEIAANFEKIWPDPILWEPGKPHLYILETITKPKSKNLEMDRHIQRFGFRDIRIKGTQFIVNGVPMKIRSKWTHGAAGDRVLHKYSDPAERLRAAWKFQRHCMVDRGCQLSRTHNANAVVEACEMADENGLMLKIEDGDVCQIRFTDNSDYWDKVEKTELTMVDTYKNHPSVFMWSAGNENIWCFGHKGAKAKEFAFNRMAKIAKSMEKADLQGRPVEWEADGDLDGRLTHYALHYPKEVSKGSLALPNDAWWPALDGKTKMHYAIHDIYPGKKPLTVGEAHWPAMYKHPYGHSVLIGDQCYMGGQYLRKAWIEASKYFINGYRDANFAVIDVYLPPSTITPHAIVLKEEERSFFSGQTITRNVNVHHDLRSPGEEIFKWTLSNLKDGSIAASGEQKLSMKPAELKRLKLSINLPKVDKGTAFSFEVKLMDKNKVLDSVSREWIIWPRIKASIPEDRTIVLFDPKDESSKALDSLGLRLTKTNDLSKINADSLIIGKNALSNVDGEKTRKSLERFVSTGGKVLILEQTTILEFLTPFQPTQLLGTYCTIGFIRSPGHPAMKGLTELDMRWWRKDQVVARDYFRKSTLGNWLPLVDCGSLEGCVDTPLLEEYLGKGSYINCQMLVSDKTSTSPDAARLLANLVSYIASKEVFRNFGSTALLAGKDKALENALRKLNLKFENLGSDCTSLDPKKFNVAIVSGKLDLNEANIAKLRSFAESGGHVMICGINPKNQKNIQALVGMNVNLYPVKKEPTEARNRALRINNLGLMSGISNHELFWPSPAYIKKIRGEGCWWSGWRQMPENEHIAEFFCTADASSAKIKALTAPCALLEIKLGKGLVLVNQLNFSSPIEDIKPRVSRLMSILMTNLGCEINPTSNAGRLRERRLRQYDFDQIDISQVANRGLRDYSEKNVAGWINMGQNDMNGLPRGKNTFKGVPFNIPSSPKAIITLYSINANNKELPKSVEIPVNRKADSIFFMHGVAWSTVPVLFRYKVNYSDGTSENFDVLNCKHVFDWWFNSASYADQLAANNSVLAWRGKNSAGRKVSVFCSEWINPHPKQKIKSVDFQTLPETEYKPIPVLLGMTLGTKGSEAVSDALPSEGEVVAVSGNNNLTIKSGNSTWKLSCIGAESMKVSNPFFKKANARFKEICLGKTFILKTSTMKRDPNGRCLVYLYPKGVEPKPDNSINAKLVGEGLAAPGNFHGNSKHQSFFDNLGFIAKSNNVGLWRKQ